MFRIKFLPARYGDAIRIAYGKPNAPRLVLIDGGTGGTAKEILADLKYWQARGGVLELLLVTHIDRDHIEGILKLLGKKDFTLSVGDFWFNGWPQLPHDKDEDEEFGPVQGERLSTWIRKRGLNWNQQFRGKAIVIPDKGALPRIPLPGGLTITLLNPTRAYLAGLKKEWVRVLREEGLAPGFGVKEPAADEGDEEDEGFGAVAPVDVDELADSAYTEDKSEANLSSIALIAEYGKKRVLLTGDAPATPLLKALNRIVSTEQLKFDLVKLSHHGSKHTTSRSLIEKISCPCYIISTNGSCFKHPNPESIARVIVAAGRPLTLAFNYRTKRNKVWDKATLRKQHKYNTRFPDEHGESGLEIEL